MKLTRMNLERLGRDLQQVAGDLETLLADLPEDLSEEAGAIRKRLSHSLQTARQVACRVEEHLRSRGLAADVFVHENAWPIIGVTIGLGLALGSLMCRRSFRG